MNLGSWFVLAVVIMLLAYAVKATFSKRKSARGGCCDTGDVHSSSRDTSFCELSAEEKASKGEGDDHCGGCAGCAGCHGCSAVKRNAVLPIVKSQQFES